MANSTPKAAPKRNLPKKPGNNKNPKKLSTDYQDKELKVLNKVLHTRQKLTLGQRAADNMALWAGSWTFIGGLLIAILIWMALNVIAVFVYRWDPYPFILLNLFLSCLAAIQAPIILMSQNRQAERDRIKAERDHTINMKEEKEIENIQVDLEEIKKMLRKLSSNNSMGNKHSNKTSNV